MKADKNFRMSSTTKAMLALMPFRDKADRDGFRRGMIQAQLSEEAARRASLKGKKDSSED